MHLLITEQTPRRRSARDQDRRSILRLRSRTTGIATEKLPLTMQLRDRISRLALVFTYHFFSKCREARTLEASASRSEIAFHLLMLR